MVNFNKDTTLLQQEAVRVFKCGHCGTRLVVLPTRTESVLPVEFDENITYASDDEFDSAVHKSHLLTCVKLRLEWQEKKKRFLKQANQISLTAKELCR